MTGTKHFEDLTHWDKTHAGSNEAAGGWAGVSHSRKETPPNDPLPHRNSVDAALEVRKALSSSLRILFAFPPSLTTTPNRNHLRRVTG